MGSQIGRDGKRHETGTQPTDRKKHFVFEQGLGGIDPGNKWGRVDGLDRAVIGGSWKWTPGHESSRSAGQFDDTADDFVLDNGTSLWWSPVGDSYYYLYCSEKALVHFKILFPVPAYTDLRVTMSGTDAPGQLDASNLGGGITSSGLVSDAVAFWETLIVFDPPEQSYVNVNVQTYNNTMPGNGTCMMEARRLL